MCRQVCMLHEHNASITNDHADGRTVKIIAHLKNSFFSSSVFKVRLLRKFITSRKSFLFRETYQMCPKINHLQCELIRAWENITTLTWKSHEWAGSWGAVETRGQSSTGPSAGCSWSCQTAPVTLETTKEREGWTNVRQLIILYLT